MYIRKSSRTYKGKTYSNFVLVESILTPKGPRQRAICSLGDLSPRPRQEWLRIANKLRDALTGQASLLPEDPPTPELTSILQRLPTQPPLFPAANPEPAADLVAVHTDQVRVEEAREAGPVHVGHAFWNRLQLDRILADNGLAERSRTLTCAMVLNRLVHPASEFAMPDWIRSTALDDLLDMDFGSLAEDALYRNLDRLHQQRVPIEKALAERERTLFNLDQTLFFYDLTSTYFEGRALANPKARRGYSRDSRPDCKQVVVGLAVNRDGFPLAHEIWAGNTADSTTVEEMLTALDKRVPLQPGQTAVMDRGMAGEGELKAVRARNLHYLVAAKQSERDRWLQEFENENDFEPVERDPSPRNPGQHKSEIRVKMRRHGEITYVLCLSSERKDKDRAIREAHEKKLLVDLEKLRKRVAKGKGKGVRPAEVQESIGRLKERYPRVARYYQMNYDAANKVFEYKVDEVKRARAETLDGSYLLKTDRSDLSAEEAWRTYILLTRAEAAFRCLKAPLGERPIFHHKELRVDAHIFVCVLAYHLLISIEKTLLDAGVHTSWATVRETLRTHQVSTIVLPTADGRELRIRKAAIAEPAQRTLYETLGIDPQILPPRREWVMPEECPQIVTEK